MIKIEVMVNSTIEKAWESMVAAEHIVNWNFASDDWHCPKAETDFRVGGTFANTMAAKDGSFSFDFGGTYTHIEAPTHLAYVLGDGRKVEVKLSETNEGILVEEYFDPEATNPEEMQQAGWQSILNNYKRYTETL